MRPKRVAEYKKYGGMWLVVHSDQMLFSNIVSDHFKEEHEAQAARTKLAEKYPPDQLFVIQKPTLAAMKAETRQRKEWGKLYLSYYQVAGVPLREHMRKYASQFRAVRELRKAKRRYPDAHLVISTSFYCKERMQGRDMQMRRIIR